MVDVTQSNDEENGPIIELIKKIIGEPRNYGLTQEEKEELARKELADREAKEALERQTKEKHEREERESRKKNIEIWTQQLQEVRKQEKEMLEAKARPFRQYIMAHVMPTLTAGMSQYLFRCSDDSPNFDTPKLSIHTILNTTFFRSLRDEVIDHGA